MSELKAKLLAKERKTAKTVRLVLGEDTVEVRIVKPKMGDNEVMKERAKKLGILGDDGKPKDDDGTKRFGALMIATFAYDGEQPLFGVEDIEYIAKEMDVDVFTALATEIGHLLNPDPEKIRGNS